MDIQSDELVELVVHVEEASDSGNRTAISPLKYVSIKVLLF